MALRATTADENGYFQSGWLWSCERPLAMKAGYLQGSSRLATLTGPVVRHLCKCASYPHEATRAPMPCALRPTPYAPLTFAKCVMPAWAMAQASSGLPWALRNCAETPTTTTLPSSTAHAEAPMPPNPPAEIEPL
jgi:hypothetical protein